VTSLLDRRFLVVTGKGGTGKTTVAAALARLAARRGKRVLLCELDATGDIGVPFDTTGIEFTPKECEPNVFVMAMDTEKAMQEYVHLNLKMPFSFGLGPFARALDFVATAAPGVREILTMGKLCWDVKRENYDLVIADAPSTGHVVSQLDSPNSIGELISVGPLVNQTAWMREMLRDPGRTGVVIVATPEEMPVQETLDLVARLDERTQTPIGAVVVNRVHPELFSRDDEGVFETLEPRTDAARELIEAGNLALAIRKQQAAQVEDLRGSLRPAIPLVFVPQTFDDPAPRQVSNEIVEALAAEMDE
jgi:anion-transporting  ArsA/GET3 family ATPase